MQDIVAESPSFRRILIATDFSKPATAGFRAALELSTELGATLFLLHVVEPMELLERAFPNSAGRSETPQECLDALVGKAEKAGLQCQASIENGIPAETILNRLREDSIDLAVLGTRAVHGIERFIFGSTAETVLRRAPCPVLTVGPMIRTSTPDEHGPVIFATDFHETTALAISYATSLSEALNARLHCLHVLPRSLQGDGNNEIIPQVLAGALRQVASESVATSKDPVCSVIYGSEVSHAVVEYARLNKAQLIVLGVRQTSIMAAHEPAHRAYRIIAEAPCPVVTKSFPWEVQSYDERPLMRASGRGESRICQRSLS